jgi:hypothetical protein
MKRTEAIKKYSACDDPTVHIFERDDPVFIKVCNLWTFDHFMNNVNPARNMFWNEIIWADSPARMYMDCEYKNIDAPDNIDLNTYIQLIHQQVQKCVQHVLPNLDPPLVMVGSRKYVFSVHFIWPSLWCSTIEPIKFIAEIVKAQRILDVGVDTGVYPQHKDSPLTLRMPFCGKLKDPGAGLMLPYVNNMCTPTYDAAVFSQYLITFHHEHSQKHELPCISEKVVTALQLNISSPFKRTRIVGSIVDWNPENPVHTLDWLELIHPLFERTNLKIQDTGEWSCYGTMHCPHADRWHKSNRMYVNKDKYGVVTCCCADSNCKVPIMQSTTEHQLQVANTPWNVDWETLKIIIKN